MENILHFKFKTMKVNGNIFLLMEITFIFQGSILGGVNLMI